MPYSTVLYERISELLPHAPHKRMFGGVVFFGCGHMLVGVFGEGMMVRVGPDAADEALAQAGVRPLASQPNRMRGFVVVDEALLDDDDVIAEWIARAQVFNRTLPPK
jgi:TfoX/Sxy family transcriptional regulator of competence genes